MLCEQGVGRWRDCGLWAYVVELVGIDFEGGEVGIDKVSRARTCLPLPFSMVESPLFGVGDCIDVPPCSNGT